MRREVCGSLTESAKSFFKQGVTKLIDSFRGAPKKETKPQEREVVDLTQPKLDGIGALPTTDDQSILRDARGNSTKPLTNYSQVYETMRSYNNRNGEFER